MILAKEKYDYYNEKNSPRPQKRVRRVKKVKKNHKAVYVFVVLVAFLLGIFFTARYAQVAMQGYQINALKERLTALQADNQRLEIEANKLKSLNRIEKIAMADLGMVKPEGVQFIAVEDKKLDEVTEPKGEAIQNAAVTEKSQDKNTVLDSLVRIFGGDKSRLDEAEAGQGN
ncbi:MAG: cell division protein FtsL [Clostridia bacterium]|nr:cell division protein FtsL [Clostridia bacterium]